MTLFSWLVLAHLVADWMLQNDWMARNKRGRWRSAACISHCTTYAAVLTICLWVLGAAGSVTLSLEQLTWFALSIFVSHLLIDGFDLPRWWGRLIGQTNNSLVATVVDQTMHLLVLAALAVFLAS